MTRRGESLELAVLGLLHESPMHGYELRKRLTVVLGWGRVLSYGSLYPALKRMLRAGLISEVPVPGDVAAVVSRRQRIVYRLTDAGEQHFKELLNEVGPSAWEDESFDVRFAFFSRTDLSSRLRILEGRRARLQERLDRVQAQIDRTQREADRYATELQRHGLESVEREVRWLSELIDAEHADQRRQQQAQQAQHDQHDRHDQHDQHDRHDQQDRDAGDQPVGDHPPTTTTNQQ